MRQDRLPCAHPLPQPLSHFMGEGSSARCCEQALLRLSTRLRCSSPPPSPRRLPLPLAGEGLGRGCGPRPAPLRAPSPPAPLPFYGRGEQGVPRRTSAVASQYKAEVYTPAAKPSKTPSPARGGGVGRGCGSRPAPLPAPSPPGPSPISWERGAKHGADDWRENRGYKGEGSRRCTATPRDGKPFEPNPCVNNGSGPELCTASLPSVISPL